MENNENVAVEPPITEKSEYSIPKLTLQQLFFVFLVFCGILAVGMTLIHFGYNDPIDNIYVESGPIRTIAVIITSFGEEEAFIIFVSLMYLGFDKRYSKILVVQFLAQTYVNSTGKELFQTPRPATNYVDGVPIETSYGFPSGHSQLAVGFWGFNIFGLQDHPKKKILLPIFYFFLILVPITRLIYGVHDMEDIVGGLTIGIAVATIYAYYAPDIDKKVKNQPWTWRFGLGIAITLGLWLITVGIAIFGFENYEAAGNIAMPCGLLVGIALSFPLEEEFVQYDPDLPKTPQTKLICVVVGLAIVLVAYLGLSAIFGLIPGPRWILRFIRYILIAMSLGLLAPYLVKILAEKLNQK